ncbi:hypothetical protein HS041_10725 [Planomonospora sp. ID67723]|uniref:hypothetical protein n=1 Tax=Planomonospora sp. ID67723 TaxID=2738134 RepID=UPI0018C37F80|nr:hypothetical protein [Planomonospora sp. ID67723]MBG0828238.1 hypothetical protein [Planomonospora sp. ID67723]
MRVIVCHRTCSVAASGDDRVLGFVVQVDEAETDEGTQPGLTQPGGEPVMAGGCGLDDPSGRRLAHFGSSHHADDWVELPSPAARSRSASSACRWRRSWAGY